MAQTKQLEQADQPWDVEPSAPTVPLPPQNTAEPARPAAQQAAPPPPPSSPSAFPEVDPQGATLLPNTPPGQRPMVIKPTADRTSRSHRVRTQTRQVTLGPSNLTLAILWGIALLSVCAAAAYFLANS